TLVITGGSSAGGMFRIALATFSRTSLAASLMSRSSTNRTVIEARPSAMRDWISSIPDTPLIASSIGSRSDAPTSSARAPRSRGIGFRKQIDAEVAERERPQHHERHDQHRGENGTTNAEIRKHGNSGYS